MLKKNLLRNAIWSALLIAGAVSAQEAAISGADFTQGKANAQLSSIGRSAAANGKIVVVTAPSYWQDKVAAKIRAGAHGKPVTIRFSNGFYENVLVRTEATAPKREAAAKPEAAMKPETATAPKPEIKATEKTQSEKKLASAPATETKIPVTAKPQAASVKQPAPEKPKHAAETKAAAESVARAPTTPRVNATVTKQSGDSAKANTMPPQPPPKTAPSFTAVPQVSQQPAVVPIPTSGANPTGIKSVLPSAPSLPHTSVQTRMLTNLNDGRPAQGSLTEAQLQSGDEVYSDGGTLAVVRMDGLSRSFYWLTGAVDLQRVQFSPQGNGRFEVTGPIDVKAAPTHRADNGSRHVVASSAPAAGSATRSQMERLYNSGHAIGDRIGVAQLQQGDRLLLDGNTILVVRRDGSSMARYWLHGSIDLGQSGVQADGSNVYEVTGNRLH